MPKAKSTIKEFIKSRKITSALILIAILSIGYWGYTKLTSKSGQTNYIVTNVKRGNIVSTVTGTGQVTASSQTDIKSKVSGDIVYLNTKANGTQITKGTLIAQVDTRDAAISLENAKIAYAKLVKPADAPTMLQAQSSYDDAVLSNKKAYDDAFNTITSSFSDLPTIMTGIEDLIYNQSGYLTVEKVRLVSQTALDLQSKAGISFDKAKNEYNSLLVDYKNLSRASSNATIESFISSAYLLTKDISESVKNIQNTLDYVRKQKSDGTGSTESTNVSSWVSTINSDVSSILSAKTTLTSTAQDIKQKNADLIKLKDGADDLDIASQKLSLQQAQNTYDNYFIRAPFDGLLARLSIKATDSVSSGTVIGTLVSSQKIATITLNEVDVERVRIGQKVKLTFDAIEGLTIDGTVITVDLVGTISQGVVNYNVEMSLDTQDDRVKSGMSVTATITTDTKENVLVVPNSAVKTQGKFNYVEVFSSPLTVTRGIVGTPSSVPPVQKRVEIGTSNDSLTEIVSGVNEGEQVVTRTIVSTATTKATPTATSLFGNTARTGTGGNTRPNSNVSPQRN